MSGISDSNGGLGSMLSTGVALWSGLGAWQGELWIMPREGSHRPNLDQLSTLGPIICAQGRSQQVEKLLPKSGRWYQRSRLQNEGCISQKEEVPHKQSICVFYNCRSWFKSHDGCLRRREVLLHWVSGKAYQTRRLRWKMRCLQRLRARKQKAKQYLGGSSVCLETKLDTRKGAVSRKWCCKVRKELNPGDPEAIICSHWGWGCQIKYRMPS